MWKYELVNFPPGITEVRPAQQSGPFVYLELQSVPEIPVVPDEDIAGMFDHLYAPALTKPIHEPT
jgi:hypothetical protein